MADLYIGLISGTSADGIDAALVDFTHKRPKILGTHYMPYQPTLQEKILALAHAGPNEIQRLGELDITLGREFARAVNELLKGQTLNPKDIQAVGSHGQTIRHHPHEPHRFTLQIGDPNIIAAETGITTIADFRRKDIALGGHGAPLVPAFHQHVLARDKKNHVVVNIGGIANITLLLANQTGPIIGFDTGPGNVLMDAWIRHHHKETHDKHGAWGATGHVHQELLENMLSDPYFEITPPKSTGPEHFSLAWLQKQLAILEKQPTPTDVQATLAEFTARSILIAIRSYTENGEILVCGGGAHNAFLMSRITAAAKTDFTVVTTKKYGIDPDWVEATAFAWLAKQTLNRKPGNLPSVTGAKEAVVLGGIYYS